MGDSVKKNIGRIIAILIFLVIVFGGILLGRTLVYKYNLNHNTDYTIFKVLTVVNRKEKEQVLDGNIKTITELCGSDIGVCQKVVGYVILNNEKYDLYINYDFDHISDYNSFFKMGKIKVGNFSNISDFAVLNDNYLVTTELLENDKFLIHIIDTTGKEIKNLDGYYYHNLRISMIKNEIYYYNCDDYDINEKGEKALYYYNLIDNQGKIISKEVSKEYGKC